MTDDTDMNSNIIRTLMILLSFNSIEFNIFGDPKRNKFEELVVSGCTVIEKKVVRYLVVHIDCNLSFDEIKN